MGLTARAELEQLETGADTTVTAKVTDFSGREMPQEPVAWESSEPGVATVTPTDPFGHTAKIRATQTEGQTTITARAGEQSAQIFISVSPPIE
jgi:uncharacterized protein YjdB